MIRLSRSFSLVLALLAAPLAHAHVGSPDTYVQRQAGPYSVLLSLHPPAAYPGVMEIDLRADQVTAAAATLDGSALQPLRLLDGNLTASLWDPAPTAHTLHIELAGKQGSAALDLPLPATAASAAPPVIARSRWLVPLLLVLPIIALILFRQSAANPARRIACLSIAAALFVVTLGLAVYAARKPPPAPTTRVEATLSPTGLLSLTLTNSRHTFADLVPDHGKLVHLFLIRQPRLDVFLHLHPTQLSPGHLQVQLPPMPPGAYTLFADLYHADGLEETATLNLGLPAQSTGHPADPDDSFGNLPPLSTAQDPRPAPIPSALDPKLVDRVAILPDGYSLLLTTPAQLRPLNATQLTVTLLNPASHRPDDMANYLGMAAHVVVLRPDGTVFAHIHPGGTLPMTGMGEMESMPIPSSTTYDSSPNPMNYHVVVPAPSASSQTPDIPHPVQPITLYTPPLPNTANIPYGFPSPGLYRLFVQMKHGHVVETAAFDLNVQ